MLHQGVRALKTKKSSNVIFLLKEYIRRVVGLNAQMYFNVTMGLGSDMMPKSLLKNTT